MSRDILKPGKRVWFLISNLIEIKNIRNGLVEGIDNETVIIVAYNGKWAIPTATNFFGSENEMIKELKDGRKTK